MDHPDFMENPMVLKGLIHSGIDSSSLVTCHIVGPNLHLHPYFVHVSCDSSGETVQMYRLIGALATS